MMPFVPTPCIP